MLAFRNNLVSFMLSSYSQKPFACRRPLNYMGGPRIPISEGFMLKETFSQIVATDQTSHN